MKDRSVAQQVDGNITFLDRQHIHELEEYTIDMKMILVNMLNNIVQVRDQYQKDCLDNSTERVQTCVYFLEEFNSYVREADMYVQRAEFLSEKVRSTAQMVSRLSLRLSRHAFTKFYPSVVNPSGLRRSKGPERFRHRIATGWQVSVSSYG